MGKNIWLLAAALLSCLLALIIVGASCGTSLFSGEKEVRDAYLEGLFAPDFPYESVKVVEDNQGRRTIVITAREKLTPETSERYNLLLLSRGVSIYGAFHYGVFSWQKTATDFAITITRPVAGEPDTVEVSESVLRITKNSDPIVAVSINGKVMRIAVERDFGHKWKKVRIIPDKEPDVHAPKIGMYPGAKIMTAKVYSDGDVVYRIAVKSPLKDVAWFYHNKLTSLYISVASSVPRSEYDNPSKLWADEVFGIKSIGKYSYIRGDNPKNGAKVASDINMMLYQSWDVNLKPYVMIYFQER